MKKISIYTAAVAALSFSFIAKADDGRWTMPYTGSCNSGGSYCFDLSATDPGGTAISVTADGASSIGLMARSPTGTAILADTDTGVGVYSVASDAHAIYGVSYGATSAGVYGYQGTTGYAGYFRAANGGTGVYALASAAGKGAVWGEQLGTGYGGYFRATNGGTGVYATVSGTGKAVHAVNTNTSGYAGYFQGRVHVAGTLSKSAGTFVIDHPQDPENKVLRHSFVESPEMKNVYDGVVVLDSKGEAWVQLPSYFSALNKDFRYQLTNIGAFAPTFVARKMDAENRFKIAGGRPGMEVSWQVTGTRRDAYAVNNPVIVEEDKPPQERGTFLYSPRDGRQSP